MDGRDAPMETPAKEAAEDVDRKLGKSRVSPRSSTEEIRLRRVPTVAGKWGQPKVLCSDVGGMMGEWA